MTSNHLSSLFPHFETLHKTLDPFTVGYGDIFNQLHEIANTAAKSAPSYPPYNIRKVNDTQYVIEMAVAGFAKSDIEVTMEGNKLIIKGMTEDTPQEDAQTYIFKGIANRNFTRTFTLADKVEIHDAELTNGMLKVWLNNMIKMQDTVKRIQIK
jgi:molecular chaperone IbpA